jgi:hypothetical protein
MGGNLPRHPVDRTTCAKPGALATGSEADHDVGAGRIFDFTVGSCDDFFGMKSRSAAPSSQLPTIPFEKRIDMRFDKVFPVIVGSEIYGDSAGVARNISTGGMLVEMMEPLPLGSVVTVHFRGSDGRSEIVARAEVKHHYCLNYSQTGEPASSRGIGLRFLEFVDEAGAGVETFTRSAVVH